MVENGSNTNGPKIRRIDQTEAEWRIIRARYRGEPYEHSEFDDAMAFVALAVNAAAFAILCKGLRGARQSLITPLAVNGQMHFWLFMVKPYGGFFRHNGIGPIGPYAFKTLKCICLGRQNRQEVLRWETPGHTSCNMPRDRDCNSSYKNGIDHRQVPLDFDPIDPYCSNEAVRRRNANEKVWSLLDELPPDQREALVLRHILDANLSEEERKRGLPKGFVHRLADRAERNLRERHPNFER